MESSCLYMTMGVRVEGVYGGRVGVVRSEETLGVKKGSETLFGSQ